MNGGDGIAAGGTLRPALAVLLLAAAGCGPSDRSTAPPAGGRGEADGAAGPFARVFAEVTRSAGITFEHVSGGYGAKLLPETLGAGAAFLDFDADGKLDIFFVNGAYWPGREPAGRSRPRCALYRGRGDGTFTDVTLSTGAGVELYGMGATAADYDGDGDEDIYITALGDNVLLRNDGGTFTDATREAGVGGGRWVDRDGTPRPEWSTAAVWLDVDGDGDIDLLVTNYVEWSEAGEIFTTFDGVTKAFTTPERYRGLPCRLFRNTGGGVFEDVSAAAGLLEHRGKALGAAVWDFTGDGRLDIAVANDTRPNFLFLNQDGARLSEQALALGVAYDESGRARAGMGIDIADYAGDGVPGIAIANFSGEEISLYRWNGTSGFTSAAAKSGLARATLAPLGFGLAFLDADLDACLDLVVVNGHIEPDIARFDPGEAFAQSAQLFRGRGDGTFADVSEAAGADFVLPRVGRGLAAGDIDGDGDLDLLVTQNGGPPALLRNDVRPGAPAMRYLRVRLVGRGKNTRALGATVRLTAAGRTQTRLVRTGSSYLSHSETVATFGLGTAAAVERLEVVWPDGKTSEVPVTAVDRTLEVRQPDG